MRSNRYCHAPPTLQGIRQRLLFGVGGFDLRHHIVSCQEPHRRRPQDRRVQFENGLRVLGEVYLVEPAPTNADKPARTTTHLDQLALIVCQDKEESNDRLERLQAQEGQITLVFPEEWE